MPDASNIPSIRGMLDREILESLVASEDIEIVLAVFPDMYGRLVGKRIMGEFFVNDVLGGELHACDYLLACDIEMEPIPGYKFTSWEQGYGDFRLHPDMNTL
ncbi:MAG: glutamine synthetase, partial [Dehalococcoidia bacterium]